MRLVTYENKGVDKKQTARRKLAYCDRAFSQVRQAPKKVEKFQRPPDDPAVALRQLVEDPVEASEEVPQDAVDRPGQQPAGDDAG